MLRVDGHHPEIEYNDIAIDKERRDALEG